MHPIQTKINSHLPKIDEVCYIAEVIKASMIGIYGTKMDDTILSNATSLINWNTSDFLEHINVFSGTGVLDRQGFYFLRDLNVNLLFDKKKKNQQQDLKNKLPKLVPFNKGFLLYFFSWTTSFGTTLIDYVLTNFSQICINAM